ncbi:MAG: TonB family protein [Pyrinomonadaceae bacterium]
MTILERCGRTVRSIRFLAAAVFVFSALSVTAQPPQLTLADILIGLRSKKATLEERNSILAEAIVERGITFSLTPEIEKELTATGAADILIAAVRKTSAAAEVPPVPAATPAPTPIPDFTFFKSRADASFGKGEYATALSDYDKAVTLKPDDAVAFLSRGKTHYNLKDYSKASADFERSIELDPKDSRAFYNRGVLFESQGELEKAFADYTKAASLDATNEAAKVMATKLKGILDARRAAAPPALEPSQAVADKPEPPKPELPLVIPDSIDLGNLSAANAINIAKPNFPPMAKSSGVEGRVVVEVKLDTEGNVVSTNVISGHRLLRRSAEAAAKDSKFRPAMFNGKPIKATGTITYNFSLRPGGEE